MSEFLGADTEALRGHAQLLADRATAIAELRERLEPMVMDESLWVGSDADTFRSEWTSRAGMRLTERADALRAWGTDLTGQADEQDQTSDPDGGSAGGTVGTGGGAGSTGGGGDGSPSLWDRILAPIKLYNAAQGAFTKGKKAWDVVNLLHRGMDAIDGVSDPLVRLMGLDHLGGKLAENVFTKPGEAFGKLTSTLLGKLNFPTGFGKTNFFGFVDDLAAKAPFLTKAAPFLGKALPVLDVGFGIKNAIDGFSSGDTFKGVTGTASAVGGGLMLAGGALSATGVGAVVGGPLLAAGAVISGGAAIADLGKAAYDNWPAISATASDAWNGASDLAGKAGDAIAEGASNLGGKVADGLSGALGSVFG